MTALTAEEAVVPASAYKALADQVRELHRLLVKKAMEAEIPKEALDHATGSKKNRCCDRCRFRLSGAMPHEAICETIGVARLNILVRLAVHPARRIGHPPLPEADLLTEVEVAIEGTR